VLERLVGQREAEKLRAMVASKGFQSLEFPVCDACFFAHTQR